jgi:RecJ-like exonuclease
MKKTCPDCHGKATKCRGFTNADYTVMTQDEVDAFDEENDCSTCEGTGWITVAAPPANRREDPSPG